MSQYIERLNDGTVRVVKYNPHHDGPVSQRLTLTKRLRWLEFKSKRFPGDQRLKKRLSDTRRQLNTLLSDSVNRPQKRNPQNMPTPHREPQRLTPLVTQGPTGIGAPLRGIAPPRDNTETPLIHPHPDKYSEIQASAT